jgi:NAD-dependent aldehyde dehydrogenases
MFINGAKYTPAHASVIQVRNPATGEIIDTVFAASAEDVSAAVSSCASAFDSWSKKTYSERGFVLSRISAALKEKEQFEKLAALLTKEQGKPLTEARREIEGVINVIDHFVGLSSSFHTDFLKIN